MNELSQHTGQGEIILYQPDETVRLEVRLDNDTVWLTTNQMAVLFDREESNIRRHIINVFKEGELERCNNVQNIHVNGVKKPVPYYALYHFGASFKDLGKRLFAFELMGIDKNIILNQL